MILRGLYYSYFHFGLSGFWSQVFWSPLLRQLTAIVQRLKFACESLPKFHENSVQTDFAAMSRTTDRGNLISEMTLILNFPVINASGLKKRKPLVGPLCQPILPQFHLAVEIS